MRGRSHCEVLHRPHLVLADAGRPDHVVAARGQVAQRLDHRLRLQHVGALRVAEREGRAPLRQLGQPLGGRAGAVRGERAHLVGEHPQRGLERADHRDLGLADLPHLGRVDVEVDHLRARGELRHLAGHAVVEARAHGDDQVALVQRPVRELRAVHAGRSRSSADGCRAARSSPSASRRPAPAGARRARAARGSRRRSGRRRRRRRSAASPRGSPPPHRAPGADAPWSAGASRRDRARRGSGSRSRPPARPSSRPRARARSGRSRRRGTRPSSPAAAPRRPARARSA